MAPGDRALVPAFRVGLAELLPGIGHTEAEGAADHTVVRPVVDFLGLLGGWFRLTRRAEIYLAGGGGGTAVYFRMEVDEDEFTGLSGGIATFAMGGDFGL